MSEMKCKRCGANENRIHGFCSMECETAWEYEDDIRDLTARIAELTECIGSQMADVYTLKARIAELEEKRRWIPVGEKPLVDGWFIVLLKNGDIRKDWTFIDCGKYFWWNSGDQVAYYMPYPEVQE